MSPAEAFTLHNASLLRLAAQWFGPQNAEDAVGWMWLKAVKSWQTWDGRASRRTWLGFVLRSEWLQQVRKDRLAEQPLDDHIERSAACRAGFDDEMLTLDRIESVLCQMRSRDREALLEWAHREGQQGRRIGQKLTLAERMAMFRARAKARQCNSRTERDERIRTLSRMATRSL